MIRYLTIFLLLASSYTYAQDIRPHKVTKNLITIDGKLSETPWNNTPVITEFKQVFPNLSNIPTNPTRVRIIYDNEAIYVGVRSEVKEGKSIRGTVLERDQPLNKDDYVEVVLDTYNDKTNGLAFRTNPLGNRFDYEVGDNGASINSSWNTFWDVGTSKSDGIWTAEYRIPFSSLRFSSSTITTMGIKIIRKAKWNNEKVIYPLNNDKISNVTMNMINSREVQFREISNNKPLYITPYAIFNIDQQAILNDNGNAYQHETDILKEKGYVENTVFDQFLSNIGLDLKYKPTANSTLDVTVNTDFAQAEADDRIINLSRFSVTLPEKRLFFLENANLFSFNMFGDQLFYSRRIGIESGVAVPLVGGIRYTGSSKDLQYGTLNMQGNGVPSHSIEAENFSIIRLRKQLDQSGSYLGVMGTNRISIESPSYSTSVGFDGLYWINNLTSTRFWSATNFNNTQYDLSRISYGLRLSHFPTSGYRYDYRYRDFKKDFNPSLGFLSRPNTKRFTINNGYGLRFNEHDWLSRIITGIYLSRYWVSSTNQVQFSQANIYTVIIFNNSSLFRNFGPLHQQDRLFTPWQFTDNIRIPSGTYSMWKTSPRFTTANAYRLSLEVDGTFGKFYGGKQLSIRPSIGYTFNRHLTIKLGADYNRIRFPEQYLSDGSSVSKRTLYTGRFNYSFSPSTSIKAFFQYDNKSNQLGSNIRFRYNPKEGNNLYLIINHNINTRPQRFQPEKPLINSQGVILKYSHTLNY